MAEDSAEALEWLAQRYPELQTPEYRERIEAELRRQGEEDRHGG